MASSGKSSRSRRPAPGRAELAVRVAQQLGNIVKPSERLVVGLSGGVDSVVLLDCLQRAASGLRFGLAALHVNHQLSPNAARWTAFCRRLCRTRGIPFRAVTVTVPRGNSLEAAARAQRYAAYARQDCDYVALAHHLDDQVETLFLQLLRGAGVKGLAAMPLLRREERGERREVQRPPRATRNPSPPASRLPPSILRPLLDMTRQEILEYAKQRRLKWIEDESNRDLTFQRNFVRHEVLPALARRFPAYRATVARSARHLAEAARLLDELAAGDASARLRNGALEVAALRRLAPARARNLLRFFLAGQGVGMPATEHLEEALRQALHAGRDARVAIELDGATLRRHGGRLYVVRALRPPPHFARRWRGEAQLALPELGGVLIARRSKGEGISRSRLGTRPVTVRLRRGGERLQPDCRRPRRSLKNLLQEAGLAPWQREQLPLIYSGDELVWAACIGADCKYQAGRDEPALRFEWVPNPP